MGGDAQPVIWDASTGQQIIALEGHTDMVWDGRWTPSGERLLTSAEDYSAKVWDSESGEILFDILFIHDMGVSRWSPDGKRILARDRGYPGPRIFDSITGEILFDLDPGNPNAVQHEITWSPSGDRVAAGYLDGSVVVWDAATGERLFVLKGHSSEVARDSLEDSLHWSPDGRWLASGSRDGSVMVWDTLPDFTIPVPQGFHNARWSPSGDRILHVYGRDGGAKIYNSTTGELVLEVENGLEGLALGDYWSPLGEKFGLGLENGELRIHDAVRGDMLLSIILPGNQEFTDEYGYIGTWTSFGWSPDGQRIATGHDFGGSIRIRDAASGEELMILRGDMEGFPKDYWLSEVRWSPTGDKILTADILEHLIIWDADSGERLLHIKDFGNDEIWKAAWSPDGQRIATHTRSNIGNIWDAASGEKLLEFSGHTSTVWGLSWAPNGDRLATGGYDNTVRVWDTTTGKQVLHYPLDRRVDHVDWSPDRKKLLISNHDRLLVLPVWNTTQELIDYAFECCLVRELTSEERERFGLPPLEE
jgi:WD40 repeat protein